MCIFLLSCTGNKKSISWEVEYKKYKDSLLKADSILKDSLKLTIGNEALGQIKFGMNSKQFKRAKQEFMDSVKGVTLKVPLTYYKPCDHCHGTGADSPSDIETCPTCRGSGRVKTQTQSIFGNMISEKERQVIRDLAFKVKKLSQLPVMAERREAILICFSNAFIIREPKMTAGINPIRYPPVGPSKAASPPPDVNTGSPMAPRKR